VLPQQISNNLCDLRGISKTTANAETTIAKLAISLLMLINSSANIKDKKNALQKI